MLKKLLILVFGILLPLAAVVAVFVGYGYVFENNVNLSAGEEYVVFVNEEDDPRDIFNELVAAKVLKNEDSFILVAQQKKWSTAKPGCYIVKEGMSNNDLVNMFRAGLQTPILVTINQVESVADVAGMAAKQLMIDSVAIFNALTNAEFLAEENLDYATVRSIIIPNTYEFYWNASAQAFRDRLLKEYAGFWVGENKMLAEGLNLSPLEVSVLASIVEKETAKANEMPVVAGLYLNRLQKRMLLQSDPTVIYAKKLKEGMDIEISRVLYADLEIDSPYNTYKYTGLPPAPITIPTLQALMGVLHADNHNYIFMCADPERPGYHSFAANLNQHNVNKQKYVKWLNDNKIMR